MSNRIKKGQPKWLPKEVSAMMKGGVALTGIAWKIAKEIIAQGGAWQDVFRLEQPDGASTITLMAKCAVATTAPSSDARGHLVTIDQSMGLVPLIERGVGQDNLGNFNRNITPERFSLTGMGVRKVRLWVEPCLSGETLEQAAERLAPTHTLENAGELAGYLYEHPEEVAKWAWVFAIGEKSRWAGSGVVLVPSAFVSGADRDFSLFGFRDQFASFCGVLVSSKSAAKAA